MSYWFVYIDNNNYKFALMHFGWKIDLKTFLNNKNDIIIPIFVLKIYNNHFIWFKMLWCGWKLMKKKKLTYNFGNLKEPNVILCKKTMKKNSHWIA